jgi:hypothetical protein
MKNAVLCDVTPCGSCKNRRSEGTCRLLLQNRKIGKLGTTLAVTRKLGLLLTANVPSSLILSTMEKESTLSS